MFGVWQCRVGRRSEMRYGGVLIAGAVVPLVATIVACGQTAAGAIHGRVTDPTGAIVADVQVAITSSSHAFERDIVTDQAGRYMAEGLSAGLYEIKVSHTGFRTLQTQATVQA